MRKLSLLASVAAASLAACTWVEPTEEGYAVQMAGQAQVEGCESVGMATAEVPDNIGFIPRSEEKVREELTTLAKNEAARIGGDTIVEISSPFQGKQKFRVYRCHPE